MGLHLATKDKAIDSPRPNVILVGAGPRGTEHLQLWERAGAQVVAVVDQDTQRFKLAALASVEGYSSLTEALSRFPSAVIVDICTPPGSHLSLILESVNAGRHVLCEKPFVLDMTQAALVLEAAKANDALVVVMHNWIGAPVFRELLTKIESGSIGDVLAINCTIVHTHTKDIMGIWDESHWVHRLPAGRLQETLPHVVYSILRLLGSLDVTIEQVSTQKTTPYPWVAEDATVIVLRSESRLVTIYLAINSEVSASRIEVVGSRQVLDMRFFVELVEVVGVSDLSISIRGLATRAHRLAMGGVVRLKTLAQRVTGVLTRKLGPGDLWIMEEFVLAVQNKSKPPVTLEEAIATVELTDAIAERIVATRSQKA